MGKGRGYERKGDAFTALVERGEGPPTVRHWQNTNTGRKYYTRVLASSCYRLDAALIGQAIRKHAKELGKERGQEVSPSVLAQTLAFDWYPAGKRLRVGPKEQPRELKAELRLELQTTQTGAAGAHGVRYWVTCPRCSRRCGVLFASYWGADGSRLFEPLTGCRECLGLTDESRQRRGTLDWASAVRGERPYKGNRQGRYMPRSWVTVHKANRVTINGLTRALRGAGWRG